MRSKSSGVTYDRRRCECARELLPPQDAFHQPSQASLQQHLLASTLLVAPLLLVGEVAGAIARQRGNSLLGHQAVQELRMLPLTLIRIDEDLADLTAELAADLRLRGADAVYVAVAAYYNLPLITWDHEQIERGGQRVTARRPDEA